MDRLRLGCRVIRQFGFAFTALVAALPPVADAQPADYPVKPVRVIVPFAAGSSVEVPARGVARRLLETLGQPFVVENRAGASGTIGTEFVAKAPRDGYTLLFTSCAHSANPSYYTKLPYDSVADFAPISQVNATYGNMLVVHPSVPARSVKEFIALAKARPGEITYASAGVGTSMHVAAALFATMARIQLIHVPYKGIALAFNDVLGGRVDATVASPTTAVPQIKAGRVRALGLGGPRRYPSLPDVPTFHESGLTGFNLTCYHGMWFPAGVPAEVTRRVYAEVAKAVALPDVRKYFADNSLIPVGSSPEEFAEFVKKDMAHHANIAKRVGIQPQ